VLRPELGESGRLGAKLRQISLVGMVVFLASTPMATGAVMNLVKDGKFDTPTGTLKTTPWKINGVDAADNTEMYGAGFSPTFNPPSGNYEYTGRNTAFITLSQTLTGPDKAYNISFYLAVAAPKGDEGMFAVCFGAAIDQCKGGAAGFVKGWSVAPKNEITTKLATLLNGGASMPLTAAGHTTIIDYNVPGMANPTLTFTEVNTSGYFYIGDVTAIPVPEPSSWWLAALGFLAVGGLRRLLPSHRLTHPRVCV
jgi:PEP-CTERM motif